MIEHINITTKATGDTLTAAEFNRVPTKINEVIDEVNSTDSSVATIENTLVSLGNSKANKNGSISENFSTNTLTVNGGITFTDPQVSIFPASTTLFRIASSGNVARIPVTHTEGEEAILIDNYDLEESINDVKSAIPHETMVGLAELGGATFDSNTNRWSLNGLDNITEAQMRLIFAASYGFRTGDNLAGRFCNSSGSPTANIRTNLWYGGGMLVGSSRWNSSLYQGQALDASVIAYNNSALEVLKLAPSSGGYGIMLKGSCVYAFGGCSKLREIIGLLDMRWCEPNTTMFRQCAALESITIAGLCQNISFASSPSLTPESVAYMINHSYGTRNFSITLHSDAYQAAMNNQDVQQALVEHANIQLIST